MGFVNKSLKRGVFEGASNPSNIEGKKYHGWVLARDLMPLSAPRSDVSVEVTIE
jgi:hypothetical protein